MTGTDPHPTAAEPTRDTTSHRRAVRALPAVAVLLASLAMLAPGASVASAAGATARFQAVTPGRLADTRAGDCTCTVLDGSTIRVQVTGRNGVPAGAVAAALTVTATNTSAAGFATVWPSGSARQDTSTLNWASRQTRANGTIVQLGQGGAVDVYVDGSLSAADVIVDVTGTFVPADASSSGAGHFRALAPARLLDTRGGSPLGGGSTQRVPLPAGVPADAVAVAVNLTATGSSQGGFLTAFAAGTALPGTSTVNTDGAGQTRAATAIVPVSALGIDVFASSTTHVLVDVFGWFTGASAGASADGLFVPIAPTRLFDTRRAAALVSAGSSLNLYGDTPAATALLGQVSSSSALVFNTTVTASGNDGFLTAYPTDTPRPGTSSVNWAAGDTVANLTIGPTSTHGVAVFASAPTHVMADLTGYFTGAPVTATEQPVPTPPTPTAAQDPAVAAIVSAGVTPKVWNTMSNVELGFLPYGNQAGNSTCTGTVGVTSTSTRSSGNSQIWQITFQRISLAQGLATACSGTLQPASAGAHEAGHILIRRWIYQVPVAATQQLREAQVQGLSPGGEECLAESVAQAMFAAKGIGPYSVSYGGSFQSCATAAPTQVLAQQVLAIAG
jgi:hypothetical protein